MNATITTHPAEDTLIAFGIGMADDSIADAVAEHLELCSDCRVRIAAVPADDFVNRLQAAKISEFASESGQDTPDIRRTALSDPAASQLPLELATCSQYVEIEPLGEGGMGVVYLAKNRLMNRREVLKVVNKTLLTRPGAVDRFLREIQSAARLHHPNVVAAYSALQLGDLLVFSMEYVPGTDLGKLVMASGPLRPADACYYAQQVARGLQHAHENGMIHRDIKPANLIRHVNSDKQLHTVKILDFGLAKMSSEHGVDADLTGEGRMLGTPDYIAPEQILNAQKADIRADIYSLGCTLYYLLTGRSPFAAATLYDLLRKHHEEEAQPVKQIRPEVAEGLSAVVAKMMAKDPTKRYQTPASVEEALTPFANESGSERVTPEFVMQNDETPAVASQSAGIDLAAAVSTRSSSSSLAETAASRPARHSHRRVPMWAWPVTAAGMALLVYTTLLAVGAFKVKTKDGIIVLDGLPTDAEVLIDGEKVTVSLNDGGKTEIRVKPGTRMLEAKKAGFKVFGEKIEMESDGRVVISAHLEPLAGTEQGADQQAKAHKNSADRKATVLSGKWRVEKNQLVQTDAKTLFSQVTFGDVEWTDYDFTVQAMRVEGIHFFALWVRCLHAKHWFKFTVADSMTLGSMNTGATQVVHLKSEFTIENDKWYKATVKVRGSRFQAFLGDKAIFDFTDQNTSHSKGFVGLATCKSVYRFKDIQIFSPTGKVLWNGVPEINLP